MNNFPNHNRFDFPENIVRVTAGLGGECLMVLGREKTALYDCGMAYCHEGLIRNIREALMQHGRKGIDYILMSHTHYDHIGAMPYILKEWPGAQVIGAKKAEEVFKSEGARRTMKRLGEAARDLYTDSKEPVEVDGFRVDRCVKEGEHIDMGQNQYFYVLETPGHTDCSMSYVLEPDSIMFTSESTGVLKAPGQMNTAILKSYHDTIESARKCREYKPKLMIATHYGVVPKGYEEEFFDLYVHFAEYERDFILGLYDQGLSRAQIMEKFEEQFWTEERAKGQPKPAFLENAKYTISHIVHVFRNVKI